MEVEVNVYVLFVGLGLYDSLVLFNCIDLSVLFFCWSVVYDLVLIDSFFLLVIVDGLVFGKYVDGVFLIIEEGWISVQMVCQVICCVQGLGLFMLGFIFNKVLVFSRDFYSYGYGYSLCKQSVQ